MRKKGYIVVLIFFAAGVGPGCSADDLASVGNLTEDSSCEDYLERPQDERHDAAVRISSEVDGVSSPGNPMWGLSADAACGSGASMTLGEYFDSAR